MGAWEIKKEHVKLWVVKYANVMNPYRKKWWYASITIGIDINEKGETIEKAYQNLTDHIFKSPYLMSQIFDKQSFKEIVKS